jgi:hypothetical protein
MAINNLNLYDVLVDLVPGTFAVGLVFLINSPQSISFIQGAGLLVFGYLAGRIIHAIGSFDHVRSVRLDLEELFWSTYLEKRRHGLSVRNRLISLYTDPDEFNNAGNKIEKEIVDDVLENIDEGIGSEGESGIIADSIKEDPVKTHDSLSDEDGYEPEDPTSSLQHFGENYIFRHDTLYTQYEALSTFYRSLWVVSFFGMFMFSLILSYSLVEYVMFSSIDFPARNVLYNFGIVLLLFFISWVSLRQRIKFRFKKTRAFFNDLNILLSDE